jgi:hypothetical protein
MGELRYLDASGDQKVTWDPKNTDQTEIAKMTFDKLKAKGYKAYSVKKDGSKNKVLSKFNPKAGLLIMAPGIAGG